ncbi:WXG100 family type VII secretion target [Lentzea sp. NPDC034063]|uniref:WXG100 family type VII secretion target n=1 Tax=unclassified Lentzea TaxID=2643253 RepID=UPI0034015498
MALTVTSEELDALAKHIADVNDQTQGTLRQVGSTVDTLAGTWKGGAATAFANLMSRFHDDAAKVQEALMAIAEQISSSADVYARNEEEQSQSMTGITSRLS